VIAERVQLLPTVNGSMEEPPEKTEEIPPEAQAPPKEEQQAPPEDDVPF
jgi:hypothetical protein